MSGGRMANYNCNTIGRYSGVLLFANKMYHVSFYQNDIIWLTMSWQRGKIASVCVWNDGTVYLQLSLSLPPVSRRREPTHPHIHTYLAIFMLSWGGGALPQATRAHPPLRSQ